MLNSGPREYSAGLNARGNERTMSDVLIQKFAYTGGTPERAKELAPARAVPNERNEFTTMYSVLIEDMGLYDASQAYDELTAIMEVGNLNPKILGVAKYLVDSHSQETRRIEDVTYENLLKWISPQGGSAIWAQLSGKLPKDPPPKFNVQIQDIFRYICMIINYSKKK